MKLTVAGYARYRREKGLTGGTRPAVQRALNDGRIFKDADGMIDTDVCDRDWEDNTDPRKRGGPGRGTPQTIEDRDRASRAMKARVDNEELKARERAFNLRKKEGQFVGIEAAERAWYSAGRRVRDLLLLIPDVLAPEIVGVVRGQVNDVMAAGMVREMLDAKLREALQSLENLPDNGGTNG